MQLAGKSLHNIITVHKGPHVALYAGHCWHDAVGSVDNIHLHACFDLDHAAQTCMHACMQLQLLFTHLHT